MDEPKVISATLNIGNLNSGAATEIFEACVQQVMDNIRDQRTDAESPRKVTLQFKFKPNSDRSGADCIIIPKVELASIKPSKGSIFIAQKGGKAIAYARDPRQEALFVEDSQPGRH